MHGTWQTTGGSGGSGLGQLLAAIGVLLIIAAVAGPVVAAVGTLVHVLLVVVAVVAGIAGAALVAYVAWRLHRWRHPTAARVTALPSGVPRAAQPLPEPQRSALERPEMHLHFHGVSAEDVAAIIAQYGTQAHNLELS
jgi:hypothetical protein